MDKMSIKLVVLALLAAFGMGNVLADQRNQEEDRSRARSEREQSAQDGQNARRNPESRAQDNVRQDLPVDYQRQRDDNVRRNGRMTPEEKQALRRQINEAGHDIYAPRR